nr:MAG TPA: Heat shock factor-binding protein 1 helix, Nucleus, TRANSCRIPTION.8A [Caudoviricetes sp.]
MSKLHDFATAVGTDIKEIKTALAGKAEKSEIQTGGVTEERLTQAITQAKSDIIGGAPEELDTLKEIADKISAAGGNTDSGIISKMTELGTRIDTIEQEDLVSVYNTAKA